MTYDWNVQSNIPPIIWPILCGIGMSIFTWVMVYLDSDEPGINPPTPFSPSKSGYELSIKFIIKNQDISLKFQMYGIICKD